MHSRSTARCEAASSGWPGGCTHASRCQAEPVGCSTASATRIPAATRPDGVAQAGLGQRHRPEAGIERRRDPGRPEGLRHACPAPVEPARAARDPPDPQVVVQLHEVRPAADLDPPAVRRPEQRRGAGRGRRDRDRERNPLAGEVADRHVDGDDRPGQRVGARQGHPAVRRPPRPGPRSVPVRRHSPASDIASLTRMRRPAGLERRMIGHSAGGRGTRPRPARRTRRRP